MHAEVPANATIIAASAVRASKRAARPDAGRMRPAYAIEYAEMAKPNWLRSMSSDCIMPVATSDTAMRVV